MYSVSPSKGSYQCSNREADALLTCAHEYLLPESNTSKTPAMDENQSLGYFLWDYIETVEAYIKYRIFFRIHFPKV